MTSHLTHEKVFGEVVALQQRVTSVGELAEGLHERLSPEWHEEFEEVERTVQLGHLFTSNNGVDFREAELALAELRGQISALETQVREAAKH